MRPRLHLVHIPFILCLLYLSALRASGQQLQPVRLRCEQLTDPLGIDAEHPRLSWQLSDDRNGALQQAYSIVVGIDTVAVAGGHGDHWESGRVEGAAQLVTYAGKALAPFTRYYWRVAVWDKDGHPGTARMGHFETGMMGSHHWKGAWISDGNDIQLRPAPYFRNTFAARKAIKSARAYIAVGGLYELYINGQRIGDHRLDPMYTRYDRRVLYLTHDVTAALQAGDNAIGVLLGNGWYNHQSTAVWYFHRAPWRNRPVFCMDLRITYMDGSVETLSTNEHWKTSLSPVIFNSIYTGEHYDARKEQEGWSTAGFNDSSWRPSMVRAAPAQQIVSQAMTPIREIARIPSVRMQALNDTTYLFDLGRNIAGVSHLRVSGPAGTVVRLKHGERLRKDGHVDQSNIDAHYRPTDQSDPFQTDLFILRGKGEEEFMPRFNYKGFQYVEVSASHPLRLTRESLEGREWHSDVGVSGYISSSNPVINKIWAATNNSYLANLFGYPTDCPQREKNGWTGDAHIAVETGLYGFDAITVYEKWLADHRDEQQANGVLPAIIPTSGWGYQWANGPDWTSTIALIPWNVYLFYGDTTLLAACYDHIKRYVDHITDLSPAGLTAWGLGDWVPVKSVSPVELTSSSYYFADTRVLALAAELLGKSADAVKYQALSEKIRDAINRKYLDTATGRYGKGWQTELSVPLFWGIVPAALKAKTAALLASRVAADSFHLDVGILGARAVLNALSENGYADIAYQVAAQRTYPSWGWWIENGATTLYENWNIAAMQDISLNHIMFGDINAWLYKGIGGILPDSAAPGFRHVLLKPHFVKGLAHFEARHMGPYGEIRSTWKRQGQRIIYEVSVPAGSYATVYFPAGKVSLAGKGIATDKDHRYTIPAGRYQFEVREGGVI
ncbi:glycoside hydrolase family 78 protein [Chitinophaga pendula]|uniref:alpha-L-rhamnosidase n=1 Tax=Chitinophaga TaxID=79328 RepID=UPI000BAFEF75|nr:MULTISPECIES: alpha-L-rhamnosidase [Chitinophaga]ASZ12420.1 alpha-rhamnosidase [Chitinophaga sp. MD30]UCJ09983.1 glycoside hydrolase family 78 protein [Chitinophaga pendula]